MNQIKIHATKMIVPAFLMNDHARSHMLRNTAPMVGRWYAGSSITNGAGSPAKKRVFFRITPEQRMAIMPRKYALGATHHSPPNTAPANKAIIGSFAPQGMNVVVITVMRRSFWFSMVREDMMPGTPQPVPIRIGTNDLPERPKRRNTRSRINAIRAM